MTLRWMRWHDVWNWWVYCKRTGQKGTYFPACQNWDDLKCPPR